MARIVETTLDVRFSAAGEASAVVESNVDGDVARQAELVCFAHQAVRTVGVVGRERGLALVQSLLLLDETEPDGALDAGRIGVRIVAADDASVERAASARVVARFLSTRRQPRMYFAMKSRSSAASPFSTKDDLAAAALYTAFASLLRRAADSRQRRRIARTAQFVARLVADGVVGADNEFDLALAAADVAWRSGAGPLYGRRAALQCPVCGNGEGFELRLWPSERDAIRRCASCGSGLWVRAGQAAQPIAAPLWDAMERLRDALVAEPLEQPSNGDTETRPADDGSSAVLAELKRVFVENRWPFAEVRDAPVLVSDLSGVWGTWKFYAQVVGEHDVVLFYSICPLRVPEEQRLEAAHFLTRANHGLASGNFELDFDDGEIRYKTVVPVDGELSPAAVRRAVRANGIAMETYLPGIGAVITGTAAQPALARRVDG